MRQKSSDRQNDDTLVRIASYTHKPLWVYISKSQHGPACAMRVAKMSRRVILPAVACLTAFLIPCSATAGPIIDLDSRYVVVGDLLVFNSQHTLTLDDLRVLDALDDNGWHLGWFKRKLKAGSVGGSLPDFDRTPTIPLPSFDSELSLDELGLGDTTGALTEGVTEGDGQSLSAVSAPEPASLFLLGSGLLVVASRLRNRAR